jgi:hypothetical protein
VVVPGVDAHGAGARGGGADWGGAPNHPPSATRASAPRDPEGLAWHFGTYQPFEVGPTA